MPCDPNYNLDNRVISFSSEHVLNGEYSATVLLMDTTRLDDPTNVEEGESCGTGVSPIEVKIDLITDTNPDTPLAYGIEETVGENVNLEDCLIDSTVTTHR